MYEREQIIISGEWNNQTPMPIYAFSARDGGQPAWHFPEGGKLHGVIWESHVKEWPRSILSFLAFSPNGWTDGKVLLNGFNQTLDRKDTLVYEVNYGMGYYVIPVGGYLFVSAITVGGSGLEVQHKLIVDAGTVATPISAIPGF